MLVIAAAVLFAIAQAQTAERAARTARTARKEAAAALEAKAQADGAAEEALAGLTRVRAQTAEQLAACQTATEQAQTAARAARAELEEVRASAAKAVTTAQEAAKAAIQKAIADRDRILAERAADMRQQIEQAKADTQTQVKTTQDQADATKAEADQLVKTTPSELADVTSATTRAENEKGPERSVEPDQATVAQQRASRDSRNSRARPRSLSGRRKPKMTPELVDKAQRMYDSRSFTMADIAQSCAVSPTTIYRHIRTGQTRTH